MVGALCRASYEDPANRPQTQKAPTVLCPKRYGFRLEVKKPHHMPRANSAICTYVSGGGCRVKKIKSQAVAELLFSQLSQDLSFLQASCCSRYGVNSNRSFHLYLSVPGVSDDQPFSLHVCPGLGSG